MGREAVKVVGGKSRDMAVPETEQSAWQRLFCFPKQQIKEDTALQSDKNISLGIECACDRKGFISASLSKHFSHLHATFSSLFCDLI